jgi:hypothetical protein
MRTDEKTRLQEQRKHLLQEMRTMTEAPRSGGWLEGEKQRYDDLEQQVTDVNRELELEHERELHEIRSGQGAGDGNGHTIEQATMSRAFAREPLYEAFRAAGFAPANPPKSPS